MTPEPWLRVLLFERWPNRWVARALEHDVEMEGRSVEGALDALLAIVLAHAEFDRRHGRAALSTFASAPDCYWTAFATATPLRTVCMRPRGVGGDAPLVVVAALGMVTSRLASPMPVNARVHAFSPSHVQH